MKVFHFGYNLQKKVPYPYPEHLFVRWIVFKIVIWHLVLEIGAKVKAFSEIKPPLSLVKSVHFNNTVARSSVLSKL